MMGYFSTYIADVKDNETKQFMIINIQLPVEESKDMNTYHTGEFCPLENGIYIGYGGFVVINDYRFVFASNSIVSPYQDNYNYTSAEIMNQ
jgi:hypothetical protein